MMKMMPETSCLLATGPHVSRVAKCRAAPIGMHHHSFDAVLLKQVCPLESLNNDGSTPVRFTC